MSRVKQIRRWEGLEDATMMLKCTKSFDSCDEITKAGKLCYRNTHYDAEHENQLSSQEPSG